MAKKVSSADCFILNQTVEKALSRWRKPLLPPFFELWIEYVDDRRAENAKEAQRLAKESFKEEATAELEQEQANVKKEVNRRLDMCKKTVARMMHIQLANAFDQFLERVLDKKEREATCKKVIQRMLHMQTARSFDRFAEAVEQLKIQRAVVSRTISKWRTPLKEFGFNGWLDGVAEQKAEEAELAHELSKQELASQLHEETQRGAEKTKKEADRRLQVCMQTVKRMFHIQLAMAFDSFRDRVTETKEKKATCKRMIHRMLHTNLAAAFDHFTQAVDELRSHHMLVQKTVARWQTPMKEVGFMLWLEYMEIVKSEQQQEAQALAQQQLTEKYEDSESRYKDLPVAVAVKYDLDFDETHSNPEATSKFDLHVQEQVSSALGIPFTAVQVMCHQRGSVVAEVVLKTVEMPGGDGDCRTPGMLAQELVDLVKERHSALCRKDLGKLAVKSVTIDGPIADPVCNLVTKAMQARGNEWHQRLEDSSGVLSAQVSKVASRHLDHCKRVIQRLLHSQLATAFDSYHDRVLEVKERRESSKRIIYRMLHAHLAAAFDGFVEAVEQLLGHRKMVLRAVSRWQTPMLQIGFESWCEYLHIIKAEEREQAHEKAKMMLQGALEEVKRRESTCGYLHACVSLCLIVCLSTRGRTRLLTKYRAGGRDCQISSRACG
jgi:hypothetical protein